VLALRDGLVEAAPLDAAAKRRSREQEALRVIDL